MLHIITTGGTIDKSYFDALSEFQIRESAVGAILQEANVTIAHHVTQLLRKDSLDLTDADRALIRDSVRASDACAIVVTHGTDTMVETARAIGHPGDKTVVLTGAMLPATQRQSDAAFNIGFAAACATILPPGVYIAMNGRVLDPASARKDRAANRFVAE